MILDLGAAFAIGLVIGFVIGRMKEDKKSPFEKHMREYYKKHPYKK